MPRELERHMEIERIAQRYGVLPTAVMRESAWLMRHVRLLEQVEADAAAVGYMAEDEG